MVNVPVADEEDCHCSVIPLNVAFGLVAVRVAAVPQSGAAVLMAAFVIAGAVGVPVQLAGATSKATRS